MKTFHRILSLIFLTVILGGLSSTGALACAACYGDTTGSKMGNAAATGIFAMVIIMFFMLSAVGGFIWHLARRAKNPLPDHNELLSDDSAPDQP